MNDSTAMRHDIQLVGAEIRTPDGVTLEADLRTPRDVAQPLPAVVLSPPGPIRRGSARSGRQPAARSR